MILLEITEEQRGIVFSQEGIQFLENLTKVKAVVGPYVLCAIKKVVGIKEREEIPSEYFSLMSNDEVKNLCFLWGPIDKAASDLAHEAPLGEFITHKNLFESIIDDPRGSMDYFLQLEEIMKGLHKEAWKKNRMRFEVAALWRFLCVMTGRLRKVRI